MDTNNILAIFAPKTGQNEDRIKWEIKSLGGTIVDVKYEIDKGIYENKSLSLVFQDEY